MQSQDTLDCVCMHSVYRLFFQILVNFSIKINHSSMHLGGQKWQQKPRHFSMSGPPLFRQSLCFVTICVISDTHSFSVPASVPASPDIHTPSWKWSNAFVVSHKKKRSCHPCNHAPRSPSFWDTSAAHHASRRSFVK